MSDRSVPADRTSIENAQLALALEVAATPTPGCVDREREYPDLRFEHFLAGVVGARPGLEIAADGGPVGDAFERSVAGMSRQEGGNTHFGALLLVVPLLWTVARGGACTSHAMHSATLETTVEDAVSFYRAFEHVDVLVDDPPAEATDLDVRRGADAIPAVRERDVTLRDVMALGADGDDNAREWVEGYPRSFRMAERLAESADSNTPLTETAVRAFLTALAERPDTLVATKHGGETAEAVRRRAAALEGADRAELTDWAEELVASGVNPGTTADLLAAGLFIALERGQVIV